MNERWRVDGNLVYSLRDHGQGPENHVWFQVNSRDGHDASARLAQMVASLLNGMAVPDDAPSGVTSGGKTR